MSKAGLIGILILAILLAIAYCIYLKGELDECNEALEICVTTHTPEPAFTLEILKDSFATFQPFNNQFRDQYHDSALPHRDGFLLQIGDFAGALHNYEAIELNGSGAASIGACQTTGAPPCAYKRGDGPPKWIDIVCGDTSTDPITREMANELFPVGTEGVDARRLHGLLDWATPITALTLWAPKGGLAITAQAQDIGVAATEPGHGHVKYVFTSSEPCEVRVWQTIADGSTPVKYAASGSSLVSKVTLIEYSELPKHGGPHQPMWP